MEFQFNVFSSLKFDFDVVVTTWLTDEQLIITDREARIIRFDVDGLTTSGLLLLGAMDFNVQFHLFL